MAGINLAGAGIECRYAVRGLTRAPGFAVGVVLVLGIATAGMATVATAAWSLFLRPVPFTHPEQLAEITTHSHTMGFDVGFSPPMLAEIREVSTVEDVAAYHPPQSVESADGDNWQSASVSHNLFAVLRAAPLAGRTFEPADAEPGAPPVALIGESAWRNRFAAGDSVIGSEIILGDERLTVIGVMPKAFTLPTTETELWRPLRYAPEQLAPDYIGNFLGGDLIARLETGRTAAEFEAALTARYADDSRLSSGRIRELMGIEFRVRGLREAWTAEQRQPLAIIGLASLLVLAAALFNVAGLWLTRLFGRTHEQAIQAALGASGWRRLGRTVIEFVLLGAAGGCVALALTPAMLGWLKDLGTLSVDHPLPMQAGPATVAITVAVLAACSLPVLVAAAWQQRRQARGLLIDLGSGGRGQAGSSARARRVLIVAQVALAMSLLCAMGLLLRSWHALLTEDLGFEPQKLLLARVREPADSEGRREDPRVGAALDELRALPGVASVAHTNVAPFARSESISAVLVPGQEDREITVRTSWVGERFFRTTGIPVLGGRSFATDDDGGSNVIVDQYFAARYFPAGDALGGHIRVAAGRYSTEDAVIIGVAGTARYRAPDEEVDQGTVYRFNAEPMQSTMAVIATRVPPATLIGEVTSVLERVLGPERLGTVVTMQRLVRDTVRDREPQLILLGLFGIETLALAGIGLFSLLAYSVRARTAEFGLRQAVGAKAGDIRRQVLGDAVRLLIPGLAIGVAGAWAAGFVIANRLYEVSPVDPVTWIATGFVLVLVVLAAGLWPAERAARIEPTEALRHE